MFTLKTKPFGTIFEDPIWKEFESTSASLFGGYHLEKEDDHYVLELPVPGLTREDIKVKLVKNNLNVKIETNDSRWTSPINKVFGLPDEADRKGIKASVENGVLLINIPKKKDLENDIEIL